MKEVVLWELSGALVCVCAQVLHNPLQGGMSQQTGVIIQPQQIVLTGNKVQKNAQVSLTLRIDTNSEAKFDSIPLPVIFTVKLIYQKLSTKTTYRMSCL